MNRGSWRMRLCGSITRIGFNEAPIHESGKSRIGIALANAQAELQ